MHSYASSNAFDCSSGALENSVFRIKLFKFSVLLNLKSTSRESRNAAMAPFCPMSSWTLDNLLPEVSLTSSQPYEEGTISGLVKYLLDWLSSP